AVGAATARPSTAVGAATAVGTEAGVDISLDEISPSAPQPGDTLVVRGTVRNGTAATLQGARVRLRISGTPLRARSEVAAVAAGREVREGRLVPDSTVDLPDALPAGSRAPFSISVPVNSLGLDGFGVYPLSVEVRGQLSGGESGSGESGSGDSNSGNQDGRQALVATFLPWSPPGAGYQASSLVWLWPVTGTPTRSPQGQVRDPKGLAGELQPSGRLGRIVDSASDGVTWMVDPDLLQSVQLLATPAATGGTPAGGTPSGGSGDGTPEATATPFGNGSATPTTPSPNAAATASAAASGGGERGAGTATSGTGAPGSNRQAAPSASASALPSGSSSATSSASSSTTSSPRSSASQTPSPTPSGTPTPAPTDPAAQAAMSWLDALRSESAQSPVLLTPYADPDLVAVHRAGRDDDLRAALALGRQVGAQVLGRPVDASVAWPANGLLPASLVTTLAQLGMSGVVLSPQARTLAATLTYTPDGRTELATGSGTLDGYVYDGDLTSLVMAGDRTHPDLEARPGIQPGAANDQPLTSGQQTLLVQEFLAETALLTAERPAMPRTFLVAPSRDWDPSLTYVTRLLTSLRQAPWVHLAPLSALATTPVDTRAARAALTYPPAAARQELPASYLSAVGDLESQLDTVSSILTRPAQLVPSYRQALLELESVAWRDLPHQRVQAAGAIAESLSKLRQAVSLAVPRNVTTGSQGATLPVTVTNGLGQPVRVRLGLTPDNPRLVVEPTQVLTIAAGRRQQVNVPVTALANGLVKLQAQLLTPAGIPLSQPVTVSVRVTQIGAVALALIAGLAALLFLIGILRLARRVVRARLAEGDGDVDGTSDATSTPDPTSTATSGRTPR
ncbi:MAG: DUF6049 family protein, partial [Actinomycetales bacterium]